jgi:membrane carboxypeptidase/penicillin-binding protein
MEKDQVAAAPEQQLPEPVAWMHNGYVSKNKWRVLHDEQNNRSCGFKAQPVHALYTADQLRTAIAAERELRMAAEERQALYLALTRDAQDIAAEAQALLSTLRQKHDDALTLLVTLRQQLEEAVRDAKRLPKGKRSRQASSASYSMGSDDHASFPLDAPRIPQGQELVALLRAPCLRSSERAAGHHPPPLGSS